MMTHEEGARLRTAKGRSRRTGALAIASVTLLLVAAARPLIGLRGAPEDEPVAGRWVLTSIDGKPLPYRLGELRSPAAGGMRWAVEAATLMLDRDGGFERTVTGWMDVEGKPRLVMGDTVHGSWGVDGRLVVLHPAGGGETFLEATAGRLNDRHGFAPLDWAYERR